MIPIDELREADLGILQGMKNGKFLSRFLRPNSIFSDVAAVEYAELYR